MCRLRLKSELFQSSKSLQLFRHFLFPTTNTVGKKVFKIQKLDIYTVYKDDTIIIWNGSLGIVEKSLFVNSTESLIICSQLFPFPQLGKKFTIQNLFYVLFGY